MNRVWIAPLLAGLAIGAAGCGAHHHGATARTPARTRPAPASGARSAAAAALTHRRPRPDPVALVTAETRNQLVSVDLRTGAVLHRLSEPSDPENVVMGAIPIVVSSASHTVSLLNVRTLRSFAVLRRFVSPHIAAFATGGRFAYVSDDGAGTVTPIDLRTGTELGAVAVGAGAHHMAVSPDGRRLWVALGESARTIVVLDTSDRAHPRVVDRFDSGFLIHDLVFSPDGQSVWISSASGPEVTVLDAATRRVRFRVAVGPPPQHIAFAGSSVYLTSGYGSRLERVAGASGRVLSQAISPYGSFELDAAGGYVVVSSLLRGTLAVYDLQLGRQRTLTLAPVTRDVAIMTASARAQPSTATTSSGSKPATNSVG